VCTETAQPTPLDAPRIRVRSGAPPSKVGERRTCSQLAQQKGFADQAVCDWDAPLLCRDVAGKVHGTQTLDCRYCCDAWEVLYEPHFPEPDAQRDLLAINLDPPNPAGNPDAVALSVLGARWARIEWKHERGYAFYDATILKLRMGGIRVLLLVDYAALEISKPASTAPLEVWQPYVKAFVQRVTELARHYRSYVDGWEIWNEPDLSRPSQPDDFGMPANVYGELLHHAAKVIRLKSSAPLITGGLAGPDGQQAFDYLQNALAAAGEVAIDGIGVHPYLQRPKAVPTAPLWVGNLEDYLLRFAALGKPLWITEVGLNIAEQQPAYLQAFYQQLRDLHVALAPHAFWFCYSDGMVPGFGLVDANGQPKPAYDVFKSLGTLK